MKIFGLTSVSIAIVAMVTVSRLLPMSQGIKKYSFCFNYQLPEI